MSWKAEVCRTRGNLLFRKDDYEGALEHYNQSLGFDRTDPITYANRGATLLRLERWLEAEADYTCCMLLEPTHVRSHSRRAQARVRLGNPVGALEDIEAATALDTRQQPKLAGFRAEAEALLAAMTPEAAAQVAAQAAARLPQVAPEAPPPEPAPEAAPEAAAGPSQAPPAAAAAPPAAPVAQQPTSLGGILGGLKANTEALFRELKIGEQGPPAGSSAEREPAPLEPARPAPAAAAAGPPAAAAPSEPAPAAPPAVPPPQGRNPALRTERIVATRSSLLGAGAVSDDEELLQHVPRLERARALAVPQINRVGPGSVQALSWAVDLAPEVARWRLARGHACTRAHQHSPTDAALALKDFTAVVELEGDGPSEEACMALVLRAELRLTFLDDKMGAILDYQSAAECATTAGAAKKCSQKYASLTQEVRQILHMHEPGGAALLHDDSVALKRAHLTKNHEFAEERVGEAQAAALSDRERGARLQAEDAAAAARTHADNAARAARNAARARRRAAALHAPPPGQGSAPEEGMVTLERTHIPVEEVADAAPAPAGDAPPAPQPVTSPAAPSAPPKPSSFAYPNMFGPARPASGAPRRRSTVITDADADADVPRPAAAPEAAAAEEEELPIPPPPPPAELRNISTRAGLLRDADAAADARRYGEAIALYARYLPGCPSNQEAHLRAAVCKVYCNDPAGGLAILDAADAIANPSSRASRAKLLHARADALRLLGRYDKALEAMDAAVDAAEGDSERSKMFEEQMLMLRRAHKQGWLPQGRAGVVPGSGPAAAPPAGRALIIELPDPLAPAPAPSPPAAAAAEAAAAKPASAGAQGGRRVLSEHLRARGNAAFQRGAFDEALEQYKQATLADPSCKLAWANRAAAELKRGRWGDAEVAATKALEIDSTYAKARARRAAAYREQRNWQAAYVDYASLADAEPRNEEHAKALKRLQGEMHRRGEDLPEVQAPRRPAPAPAPAAPAPPLRGPDRPACLPTEDPVFEQISAAQALAAMKE